MSIFSQGTFNDPLTQDDLEPTTGERLKAVVGDAWSSMVGPSLYRWGALDEARKWGGGAYGELSPDQARAWIDEHGLTGHLSIEDRQYNPLELSILAQRKRAELQREYVLERASGGAVQGAEHLLLSLGTSLADPLTVATAFVPVVNEATYGRLLAQAGESALARAGVRAGVGALEGATGQAIVEPIVYGAHKAEQADYTLYDSLANIAFGGIFGGGLHAVGGAVVDWRTGRREGRLTAAGDALRGQLDALAKAESVVAPAVEARSPETMQTIAATMDTLHAARRAQLVEQASGVLPENVRVETEARLKEARAALATIDESLGGDGAALRNTIAEAEQALRTHELADAAQRDLNRLDKAWDGADLNGRADLLGVSLRSQIFEAQTFEAATRLSDRVQELSDRAAKIEQDLKARQEDADPLPGQVDPVTAGPFDQLKAEIKARDIASLESRLAAAQSERDAVASLRDRWQAEAARSAAGRAAAAAPQTRENALRAAVAQDLTGEPVNVEPLFELDPATRTRPIGETLDELRRPAPEANPEPVPTEDAAERPAVEQQVADLTESLRDLEAQLKLDGRDLPEDIRAEFDAIAEVEAQSADLAETARMLAACAMRSNV